MSTTRKSGEAEKFISLLSVLFFIKCFFSGGSGGGNRFSSDVSYQNQDDYINYDYYYEYLEDDFDESSNQGSDPLSQNRFLANSPPAGKPGTRGNPGAGGGHVQGGKLRGRNRVAVQSSTTRRPLPSPQSPNPSRFPFTSDNSASVNSIDEQPRYGNLNSC